MQQLKLNKNSVIYRTIYTDGAIEKCPSDENWSTSPMALSLRRRVTQSETGMCPARRRGT